MYTAVSSTCPWRGFEFELELSGRIDPGHRASCARDRARNLLFACDLFHGFVFSERKDLKSSRNTSILIYLCKHPSRRD
jgi:hypothetical protein